MLYGLENNMAQEWIIIATEVHEYRIDIGKDVSETEAEDLFFRGHFKPGYTDKLKTTRIIDIVPVSEVDHDPS